MRKLHPLAALAALFLTFASLPAAAAFRQNLPANTATLYYCVPDAAAGELAEVLALSFGVKQEPFEIGSGEGRLVLEAFRLGAVTLSGHSDPGCDSSKAIIEFTVDRDWALNEIAAWLPTLAPENGECTAANAPHACCTGLESGTCEGNYDLSAMTPAQEAAAWSFQVRKRWRAFWKVLRRKQAESAAPAPAPIPDVDDD